MKNYLPQKRIRKAAVASLMPGSSEDKELSQGRRAHFGKRKDTWVTLNPDCRPLGTDLRNARSKTRRSGRGATGTDKSVLEGGGVNALLSVLEKQKIRKNPKCDWALTEYCPHSRTFFSSARGHASREAYGGTLNSLRFKRIKLYRICHLNTN